MAHPLGSGTLWLKYEIQYVDKDLKCTFMVVWMLTWRHMKNDTVADETNTYSEGAEIIFRGS